MLGLMGIAVGSIQYLPKGVVIGSLNDDPTNSTIVAGLKVAALSAFGQVTVAT